ncbi:hypothetical protein AB0J90_18185 [Micromonospora sp. NPDC049523]|uniref:hypothetical protein n=1 Tax=Micromonospora sp. NPDC049523 TaxID=3155921 RepID=UPI00343965EC
MQQQQRTNFTAIVGRVVLALALGIPLAVAPTTPALAAGCYDGSVWAGGTASDANTFDPSRTGYYTTTSRCNDINFLPVSTSGDSAYWDVFIRVCWVNLGTCNSWKSPDAGEWTVIASNVKDGTRFRVETDWTEPMWGSRWNTKIAF